ncbi:MAG: DNA helicase UvrD, partial [Hominenteromicrobium sp.]
YTEKPHEGLIAQTREYIAYTERFLTEDAHTPRFTVGQRVRHSVFGAGEVLDVDTAKSAYLIRFDEIPTPRSISFRVKLFDGES